MPHINWSSWDINDGQTIKLPAEWEICTECSGDGHHAKGFGAFTSSDMDEWGVDPDEFMHDYMSGRYDQRCEDCDGTGKVLLVADAESYAGTKIGEALAAYWAERDAEAQEMLAREYERRMGC